MNFFYISFFIIIILILLTNIQSKTEEYYECINPDKTINSQSKCTSIKIPVSDGYKCCALEIQYGSEISYNCFAIETEYTKDSQTLNEYMSKRNLDFLFTSTGGKMSIDCGDFLNIEKYYKKYSDSFLNCYNGHTRGVEKESDCYEIVIPEEENSKCCYLEKIQINENGNTISDKRCYIIDNIYFSGNKKLSDFILDTSNLNSLDDIIDTNIIIKCKNIDTFYLKKIDDNLFLNTEFSNNFIKTNEVVETTLKSELDILIGSDIPPKENIEKKKSGLPLWSIIVIVVGGAIIVGVVIIIIIYCSNKRRENNSNVNTNPNNYLPGIIGPKV